MRALRRSRACAAFPAWARASSRLTARKSLSCWRLDAAAREIHVRAGGDALVERPELVVDARLARMRLRLGEASHGARAGVVDGVRRSRNHVRVANLFGVGDGVIFH